MTPRVAHASACCGELQLAVLALPQAEARGGKPKRAPRPPNVPFLMRACISSRARQPPGGRGTWPGQRGKRPSKLSKKRVNWRCATRSAGCWRRNASSLSFLRANELEFGRRAFDGEEPPSAVSKN